MFSKNPNAPKLTKLLRVADPRSVRKLRQERNLCSHPRHSIPQPRRGSCRNRKIPCQTGGSAAGFGKRRAGPGGWPDGIAGTAVGRGNLPAGIKKWMDGVAKFAAGLEVAVPDSQVARRESTFCLPHLKMGCRRGQNGCRIWKWVCREEELAGRDRKTGCRG